MSPSVTENWIRVCVVETKFTNKALGCSLAGCAVLEMLKNHKSEPTAPSAIQY